MPPNPAIIPAITKASTTMTELKAIRPPAQNINDRRADTTTPMAEPKAPRPIIVLSTTVAYRGRVITISNEGMTLDAFCDMLDKKFGACE
jgi:hypothetical protein